MRQELDHDLRRAGRFRSLGGARPVQQGRIRNTDLRLLDGGYDAPLRIVCFNTAEGRSRVVTTDVAAELQQRSAEGQAIPPFLQHLLELAKAAEKNQGDAYRRQKRPLGF